MSPTSPKLFKAFPEWELNTSLAKYSTRHSQQTHIYAWACQVSPASSYSSGANSPPGGDRWTAQLRSSPECSKHVAKGPKTRLQPIIGLLPRVPWHTDKHPYA
ncbi:hypothetical protein CHARACLAT_014455 [Characodon lateralis]|uniref:Uncharacterized protein n=1 Tax=Characodon lateralis TaxID=208331 RepID=A0ABU7ETU6_9TELE|nr:hypothetical protein [Characodon lateralis]